MFFYLSGLSLFLMKTEIKYNADAETAEIISRWQEWLKSERRYSPNTCDAYFRDFADFTAFFDAPLTLTALKKRASGIFALICHTAWRTDWTRPLLPGIFRR